MYVNLIKIRKEILENMQCHTHAMFLNRYSVFRTWLGESRVPIQGALFVLTSASQQHQQCSWHTYNTLCLFPNEGRSLQPCDQAAFFSWHCLSTAHIRLARDIPTQSGGKTVVISVETHARYISFLTQMSLVMCLSVSGGAPMNTRGNMFSEDV